MRMGEDNNDFSVTKLPENLTGHDPSGSLSTVLSKSQRISYPSERLIVCKLLQGSIHNNFHVSNLKKCLSDESLIIPMKELQLDNKLNFVEEPVEIMDREIKQLKRSRIPIVKGRWNSKRGPEFTWEREDEIRAKYPQYFNQHLLPNPIKSQDEISVVCDCRVEAVTFIPYTLAINFPITVQLSPSTPSQPQAFEIGETSRKSAIKRHEEQIQDDALVPRTIAFLYSGVLAEGGAIPPPCPRNARRYSMTAGWVLVLPSPLLSSKERAAAVLESTAGAQRKLVLEQPEVAESKAIEVYTGLNCTRATMMNCCGTSKRVRHVSLARVYRRMRRSAAEDTVGPMRRADADLRGLIAQKLARKENGTACQGRAKSAARNSCDYKASCHWAVKYLEGGKNNHFAGLDEFRQRVEELLEKQEEKLRKLSIDHRALWKFSVGQAVPFGDVLKCALALELVAAMETMKLLELPHIAQLERDQDYPIDVPIFACPRDILNPFALEKEIPLKESLEAHAIRLAKKKGVKGKAILCGVGAGAQSPVLMEYQLAWRLIHLKIVNFWELEEG
ncbi:hypothetical protein Tco_1385247 [Tanacetum coccineum]